MARSPFRSLALIAVGLCALCWIAEAGPRTGGTKRLGQPVLHAKTGTTRGVASVCKLGEHGDVDGAENVVYFDEDDTYFSYLNVTLDSCATCGDSTYAQLTAAHLVLYYPFAPETLRVRLSVLGVVPVNCRFQDPTVVFCSPFEVRLDSQDSLVFKDHEIAFPPPECKIMLPPFGPGRAFLSTTFLTASDTTQAHKPQLAVQQTGRQCVTWNPVGFENLDFTTTFNTGNPLMFVDVAQCPLTPNRRKTWGALKMMYR